MRRLILALVALLVLPALARAQVATFLQTAEDETDLTTYTFSSQNIGAAAADRYIIVVTTARKSSGSTDCNVLAVTVTINGTAMTQIAQNGDLGTTCSVVTIHKLQYLTGTTANIVAQFGVSTMLRSHIAVYRSTGTQTVAAFGTGSSLATDPTGTLTIPAGGYAIGGATGVTAAATATWTGLTTETYDAAIAGTTVNVTGAMLTPASLQSGITVTADWTASTESIGVWASWEGTGAVGGVTALPTATVLGVGGAR